MIKSEKQFEVSQKKLEDLRASLEIVTSYTGEHGIPVLTAEDLELNRQVLLSEIAYFETEIKEYSDLLQGKVFNNSGMPLEELPKLLIKSRIAKNISQSELARKLGLKAQAIQRYEANEYAQASFSRLLQVAQALGLVGVIKPQ